MQEGWLCVSRDDCPESSRGSPSSSMPLRQHHTKITQYIRQFCESRCDLKTYPVDRKCAHRMRHLVQILGTRYAEVKEKWMEYCRVGLVVRASCCGTWRSPKGCDGGRGGLLLLPKHLTNGSSGTSIAWNCLIANSVMDFNFSKNNNALHPLFQAMNVSVRLGFYRDCYHLFLEITAGA